MVTKQNRQRKKVYLVKRRRKLNRRGLIILSCLCLILVTVLCFLLVKAVSGLLFPSDEREAGLETLPPSEDEQVIVPTEDKANDISKGYIILDPGHGGDDSPGCVYGDIIERDVTLELSFLLRDELVRRNYTVLMTREEDKEILLRQRAKMANESGADLFISIHLNSHDDTSVHGIETWFNPHTNARSSELAEYVQQSVASSAQARDRGTYSDTSLIITREVLIPSCLVEAGYLSNDEERQKITTEAYQKKLATGIADGVDQYFGARHDT